MWRLCLALCFAASAAVADCTPVNWLTLPLRSAGDPVETALETAYPGLDLDRAAGTITFASGAVLPFAPARQVDPAARLVDATIGFSASQASLGEDWHYGMGVWLECAQPVSNCSEAGRYSSAGAFGGSPFIDFQQQVFGILARQGEVGTFVEGKATFDAVRDLVQQWAATF